MAGIAQSCYSCGKHGGGAMEYAQPKSSGKTSRFKGVYLDSRRHNHPRPWRVALYHQSRQYRPSGFVASEEEAAREYDRLALEHGRTDCLNFPDEAKTSSKVKFRNGLKL